MNRINFVNDDEIKIGDEVINIILGEFGKVTDIVNNVVYTTKGISDKNLLIKNFVVSQ